MKLKMLITVPAGVDGVVKEYAKDSEPEFITEAELALAALFERHGYAVRLPTTKRRSRT